MSSARKERSVLLRIPAPFPLAASLVTGRWRRPSRSPRLTMSVHAPIHVSRPAAGRCPYFMCHCQHRFEQISITIVLSVGPPWTFESWMIPFSFSAGSTSVHTSFLPGRTGRGGLSYGRWSSTPHVCFTSVLCSGGLPGAAIISGSQPVGSPAHGDNPRIQPTTFRWSDAWLVIRSPGRDRCFSQRRVSYLDSH